MFILAKNFNLLRQRLIPNRRKILSHATYCQKNHEITETSITDKLKLGFPKARSIFVEDTSGGCGAMFNISIEAEEFKGLSVMKQHRLVYNLLEEQLKAIHGLHLQTKSPK